MHCSIEILKFRKGEIYAKNNGFLEKKTIICIRVRRDAGDMPPAVLVVSRIDKNCKHNSYVNDVTIILLRGNCRGHVRRRRRRRRRPDHCRLL